jgi:inner membrane protein
MMTGQTNSLLQTARKSPLLRVLLIGFLILLLQIPIAMIDGLIAERRETRDDVMQEVTDKWGREQTIVGPALMVPYVHRWTETDERGQTRARKSMRHAIFLPEALSIDGNARSESRHRGIFEVPVYRAAIEITGRFGKPEFSDWGIPSGDVRWDRAQLIMRISDARAIQEQVNLQWNGEALPFEPGAGEFGGTNPGIHVPLKGTMPGESFEFSLTLKLNGSTKLRLAPFGRDTTTHLESSWPNPSFQGNWLPTMHDVSEEGFEANWVIPYLGRNYPQQWRSSADYEDQIASSLFGVDFLSPIDNYRMSARSVKYEIKFLLMTFLVIWLFEVVGRLRVHSVQYLLVGAGMCLFYLLQLSLAEHLGFLGAYLIASAAVTVLITSYSLFVVKTGRRAAVIGGVLAALYAYLYILLREEDYALLVGSIGLFAALAIVMYATRKIEWHNLQQD